VGTGLRCWEGCTHHIKDVGSFADIYGFIKRQHDFRDEPEEERSCGYWPCRWANDPSRAYDVRYGVTLLRSAHNPNEGVINMRYRRGDGRPQKTYCASIAPCNILSLMERMSSSSPSYRAIQGNEFVMCMGQLCCVADIHSRSWRLGRVCPPSNHPRILPPRSCAAGPPWACPP
jgi:hypothetical protein